jgi:hypothetical protein
VLFFTFYLETLMFRTLSLIAVLAAFAAPAFAADAITTTTTTEKATTIAAAAPKACDAIATACKASGFSENAAAAGKDLYKDCVSLIAEGKAVQGVKFTADTASCKAELAAAAPAATTSTTATTTTTTEPAALAPSAGAASSTTTIEKTTTEKATSK